MFSKGSIAARYFLGVIMLVFGLNKFIGFIPQPPPPESAQAFMGGLFQAGYFFPTLALTEIVVGALLLANLFVPLALVIIAPVILQIVLYHLFLAPDPMGTGMAFMLLASGIVVALSRWPSFSGLLKAK